ncbi:MAG: class I SAM-dependent methyltransferase [Bacteroidales bacterium]|nr:class I SAM-dependent methyltransferase [Bacteroidales bacterium]
MINLRFYFKYLKYFLFSRHESGYGIHSPFVFNFINNVIYENKKYYCFNEIENLRNDLLECNEKIFVKDLGAGSGFFHSEKRKIKSIVRYSAKNKKYGQLMFRIVNYFKPKNIIELGTSVGLTTLYISKPLSKTNVYTIEGSEEIAKIANQNFEKAGIKNIKLIIDNFDNVLSGLLNKLNFVDLVFFDGNHTKDATIKYFNLCLKHINDNTIFIFDDIHWSKGMEEAWQIIKNNNKVIITIDIFFMGIVFFNKECSKEDFVIRY